MSSRISYTWTYTPDTGRHSLGWNRKAKQADKYAMDAKPTGERAAR